MALKVLDAGLQAAIDYLCGNTADFCFDSCSIGLYTNNHTPVQSDTLGAFTEAAWTGYARQTVSGIANATLAGGIWSSVFNAVLIPNSSGVMQSAYGLLIFSTYSGALLAAALFAAAPVTVSTLGLIVQVTLQDTDM